jgi:sortase (surface protein transpeptidase)
MKRMGRDRKACTLKCIEHGSKIVLYDASRRRVYRLDNTETVLPFAGQKVRITGTLRGNEITVATIENVI